MRVWNKFVHLKEYFCNVVFKFGWGGVYYYSNEASCLHLKSADTVLIWQSAVKILPKLKLSLRSILSPTLSLFFFLNIFCPLCISDKLAHPKGIVKTSNFIKYRKRCGTTETKKNEKKMNGGNMRETKKRIDRERKEIWALCGKGQ